MSVSPLFDRNLYLARLARRRGAEPDPLSRQVAAEFAERLDLIRRQFDRVRIIAPDPRPFVEALRASGKAGAIEAVEPPTGDDLRLAPQGFNAVFDLLDLHAANDVPGRIAQAARALQPDGLYMACLLAGESLGELRQSWLAAESELTGGATLRVAPMAAIRELGALLQRGGLALPVADLDRTIVRYADPIALMHEISAMGMANMMVERSRRPVSKALFGAAAAHYQAHFADADNRVRATLELAWLIGWAPHQSQQQPLKPGTAKARLADALKVREEKLD